MGESKKGVRRAVCSLARRLRQFVLVCFAQSCTVPPRIWFVRQRDRMMYRFACFQFRRTFIPHVGHPRYPVCSVYIAKMYYICDTIRGPREREKIERHRAKENAFCVARPLYLLKTWQDEMRARARACDILCGTCLRLSLCETQREKKDTSYRLFDPTLRF